MAEKNVSTKVKSLENWIWDAACAIRGAKEAGRYKDYILPLIFVKRLCDVFDDELNRIAEQVGGREKAFKMVEADHALVRFYLPLKPENVEANETWSVIRKLSKKIGETLTAHIRDIANDNPSLKGIIDRIDFNATTHGQRDIDDDRLSNLIEAISKKRLGLADVEPDLIGRSYEYLIRKFAENSGKSAGEFYTPREVGMIMAHIMDAEPGMEIYDPTCGSAGLLIKCELVLNEKMHFRSKTQFAPLQLNGQEYAAETWAMARMNMIIHDMEGDIEIGDTFNHPKLKDASGHGIRTFDRVVANPMWNQSDFSEAIYANDEFERFPAGSPGGKADWGWMQHIYSSLKPNGRAAVVLDTGALSRGSGSANTSKERDVRKWFLEHDIVEGVIYLPDNLFYNTNAPGAIIFLNKQKSVGLEGKIFLLNASKEFEKGDPKNAITETQQQHIVDVFKNKTEEEGFSKFITLDETKANDYNISPSRYIHVAETQEYQSIPDILAELKQIEQQAGEADKQLQKVLRDLGF